MKFVVVRLSEDKKGRLNDGKLNKLFVSSKGLTGFSELRKDAQEFDSLPEASATANALEHVERRFSSFVKTDVVVCMKIEEVKEA